MDARVFLLFKSSRWVLAVGCLGLALMMGGCSEEGTVPPKGAASGAPPTALPTAAKTFSPSITPADTLTPLPIPLSDTPPIPPAISEASPTPEATLTPADTLTPVPTLITADFPSTILYAMGGGGPGDCESVLEDTSERGISAGFCYGFDPYVRRLTISFWGMPLEGHYRLALTPPGGGQALTGSFDLIHESGSNYRVSWPGMENYAGGAVDYRADHTRFVDLFIWWPGEVPAGTWTLKAVTGSQAVRGSFDVPAVTHPWVSLLFTGHDLHIEEFCHILPAGSTGQPIPVTGAGFQPGQRVTLVLYLEQANGDQDELVPLQVQNVRADGQGRISASFDLAGAVGRYWLIPVGDGVEPFYYVGQDGPTYLGGGKHSRDTADCFEAR